MQLEQSSIEIVIKRTKRTFTERCTVYLLRGSLAYHIVLWHKRSEVLFRNSKRNVRHKVLVIKLSFSAYGPGRKLN